MLTRAKVSFTESLVAFTDQRWQLLVRGALRLSTTMTQLFTRKKIPLRNLFKGSLTKKTKWTVVYTKWTVIYTKWTVIYTKWTVVFTKWTRNICVRINYGPLSINYGPLLLNYGPLRINYGPLCINHGPLCINYGPLRHEMRHFAYKNTYTVGAASLCY